MAAMTKRQRTALYRKLKRDEQAAAKFGALFEESTGIAPSWADCGEHYEICLTFAQARTLMERCLVASVCDREHTGSE